MSDIPPIPVTSATGWWTATGAFGTFCILLGVVVRQIIPWKRLTISAEEKMREELRTEKAALQEEIADLNRTMEKERAIREMERRHDNHRIVGLEHVLDMMLELLTLNPDKVHEIVPRMNQMRQEQKDRFAKEKGEIMAAKMNVEAAE